MPKETGAVYSALSRVIASLMSSDKENRQEDQWLSAMAGRADPKADPETNREAELLRNVLLRRKEAIDKQIGPLDPGLHETILKRALEGEREEYEQSLKGREKTDIGLFGSLTQFFEQSVGGLSKLMQPRVLGLSASFTLVIAFIAGVNVFNANDPRTDYAEAILKNIKPGMFETLDNPEVRAVQLKKGIETLGSEVKTTVLGASDGKDSVIKIEVQNTSSTFEYLEEQGFFPNPDDETLTLILKKNSN